MKTRIAIIVGILVLALGGWAFMFRGEGEEREIEYRYSKVIRGEIVRSISATGQVVADTTVDVKSKAGGKVVQLAVDEGAVVKRGDLIAIIDPSDTEAVYEQASADLASANARAAQAEQSYKLQVAQAKTDIADARAAVEMAKVRLQRAKIESNRQPTLTTASLQSAQAAYDAALANFERLEKVTIPQMRREASGNLSQAKAQRETAASNLERQKMLLQKGYVATSAVEQAESSAAAAKTAYDIALQRTQTLEAEVNSQLQAEKMAVARAKASLDEAKANRSQNDISKTSVAEAEKAVRAAEIDLQRAISNQIQNNIRRQESAAAKAATVRNQVALKNAKVQLDSTTVVAPRDGVVTMKYLEEGTIIPPGTSTFAQGTSLVQISDVTQLFVECAVDEADISSVKAGQTVRITADAYPGRQVPGVVTRVNPAATTENNVTAIKVRVKVLGGGNTQLLPGMNASCEFITLQKPNVLLVPSQALDGDTVRVKTADPLKPLSKQVEVGEFGNENIEILSGLEEGDEVVTAEIDLALLRETQERMQQAEEGGGLAGGGPMGGRRSSSSRSSSSTRSGGGGGQRPAGGGGR